MRYVDEFKQTIMAQRQDRIRINHVLDNKDVSYASEFKINEGLMQSLVPRSYDSGISLMNYRKIRGSTSLPAFSGCYVINEPLIGSASLRLLSLMMAWTHPYLVSMERLLSASRFAHTLTLPI